MPKSLKEEALKLPMQPGVYIMKDKSGQVIYVGKAKKLKNRVSSYFHGEHNAKTEAMISKIDSFDVIIASSEFEALVLENSLIKRHMPKYNILLRDDKGYPFIRIDMNEPYPTFSVVSRVGTDGAGYFGPYGGRNVTFSAINSICKALKLPTCGKVFPRDIGKERPCLNHHMGACRGWCMKGASKDEYREAMETAILILSGKTSAITAQLTAEMNDAAENLRFELAAEKRDRLRAIEALETKQRVVAGSMADTDAVGFYRGAAKCCFTVLHYINGSLLDKDYELLEQPSEEDGEAVSSLIRQYYIQRGAVPASLYLPCDVPDLEPLRQFLSELAGKSVHIFIPQRGEKARISEAAQRNAVEETERASTREEKTRKTMEWLRKALCLAEPPDRFEAYDISNTGSSDIVAAMTVFSKGRPLKRDYRRFKIKTIEVQDDFASMYEVISRRMERFRSGDEKFAPLPDVLLIDGGVGQVNAAVSAMEELDIHLPVFGMVKDDRHRTRALVTVTGEEIGISAQPAVFAFIGSIQEETHRFAIEFHRSLRGKHITRSELDGIPGIGEKRKNELLKKFGSISAIREADMQLLRAVLPSDAAKNVYDHFHPGEEKK